MPVLNRRLLVAASGLLLFVLISPHAFAQLVSNGSGGNLELTGAHVINTDNGEIDAVVSAGWDGLHFHFVDITVDPIAQVSVIGTQPLTLLASGNVEINGSIVGRGADGTEVLAENLGGASGGAGGAGGYAGGVGGGNVPFGSGTYFRSPGVLGDGPAGGEGGIAASSDNANLDAGSGGGAGHATPGANGGSVGNGVGGTAGGEVVSGFLGGSGGGGGSQEDDNSDRAAHDSNDDGGAGGGGGGAAFRIAAAGTVSMNGLIDVSGGAGGDSEVSGAGGGGAGGRVEVFAATLPVIAGNLMVDGGPGGTGPEIPQRAVVGGPDGGSGAAGTTRVESYVAALCSAGGPNLILGPGDYTIDTDTGEIDDVVSAGFDGFAFHFNNVDIADGATLVAKGTAPLVMLAGGDVTIAGIIDAAGGDGDAGGGARDGGSRGAAGPGGFAGGRGGGVTPGTGTPDGESGLGPGGADGGLYPAVAVGGGGGGHAVMGQDSMNSGGSPAPGGAAYAIDSPLVGGSGGGGGTVHNSAPTGGGGGGGGGGAVRVIGSGDVTVTGTIDVHGGGGGRGPGRAGGGGGGAGGSIDLQVAGLLTTGAGTLDVSGGIAGISGSGPAGGGTGSDGRLTTSVSACAVPTSDLSVTKTVDPLIFAPGAQITYTINVTNAGPLGVGQANLTDMLPAELTAVSWDCFPEAGASCTAQGTGNINDDMLSLPVGVSAMYVVTATAPTPFVGILNNTASVTPLTLTDSDTANNSASARTATDQGFADGFETQTP